MAYDISALTPQEQITALYIAYYDRAPDPGGLAFWTARLQESLANDNDGDPGLTFAEIAEKFAASAESKDVYPDFLGDSNNDGVADGNNPGLFVTQVYINLFNRSPDPDGLNHWVKNINNGNISPAEALLKIIAGAQGTDIDVLNNKLEVAGDWTQSAIDDGVLNLGPADEAEARSILDGIDETQQSVNDAKDTTDAYFNEAPTAANESDSTNEDAALNGDVSDKTDDADGDTLTHTVEPGDGPSNGTVSMNSDGTYTYTPNANFNGSDSFTYTVDDGNGGTDTGTVFLTVNAINDAPVAQTGIVSTTAEDNAVNGSVSSSDVDGGAPSYSVASGPANGSVTMNPDGTYTYTPDADFNGTDSFAYTVNDGNGGTDTAVVNITINPVDDAPVAQDESATATEDGAIVNGQLDADDIDNNNANITYALNAAAPAGLTVNGDGTYSFDPTVPAYQSLAAGQTQVVVAGYTATSNGKSDTGTITVTVTGTNDAPVATAVAAAGVEDTVIAGLAVATDVDNGDTLTYSVEAGDGPSNGGVTMNQNGSFEYTPDANFNGTDSFTYTVTDSQGATATATVTLTVAAATDELTAGVDNFQGSVADDIVTGNENTLNAGDTINGNDGDDTLIINVNTNSALNFAGFEAHVETFRTTIDGSGSATFDMSGSEITGNTFINTNSTADVTYDRVNMNPDGPDADSRPQLDVELRNVTQGASTTFTTRPAEVVGGNDEANVLMTNLDNNAHIGALSFFGTPNGTDASGIEIFDLSTQGSPLPVFLNDLNTPGGTTVNIDTTVALTIGDSTVPGDVAANSNFNLITGTSGGSLTGIDNPLSSSITTIDATADNGAVTLSVNDNTSGVTGTFGGGNDQILGGTGNDNFSGGEGNDFLVGDEGGDSLFGEGGNDTLLGDGDSVPAGNDLLEGGAGNDLLIGFGGNDTLRGGNDNDTLMGGSGNDLLEGDDGDDAIHLGSGTDIARGGLGADMFYVNGGDLTSADQIDGRDNFFGVNSENDVLTVTGSSVDTAGLNGVTQISTIFLNDGVFTYNVGFNSDFENYFDDRSGPTMTVDGTESTSVNLNFTGLNGSANNEMTIKGGDGNDIIRAGNHTNTIFGDGDLVGTGGDDLLVGNNRNDDFRFNVDGLTVDDTVNGNGGTDTVTILDLGNRQGEVVGIGANFTGIETMKIEDIDDTDNGDIRVNIGTGFTNAGLFIDGSDLDGPGTTGTVTGERLTVDISGDNADTDINILGGDADDTFIFGQWFDGGDTIDGGDPSNSDSLHVDAGTTVADADFANTTNVETLVIDDTNSALTTITLGANAYNGGNGIKTVDLSALDAGENVNIDASAFGGPLTIIGGDGDDTIVGPNSDPLTLVMGGGNDNVTTGTADDVIQIGNGDLTGDDTITDNGGNDSVEFQNMDNANAGGIAATVDLDNVTGIENYTFAGSGDRNPFAFDADAHTLTFQGGNVGTVTDINVDGSNVTDGADSLEVVIGGTDSGDTNVDVDYRFTIDGTAGNDRLYKANNGLNNQIVFNGGAGSDTVSIFDGDLGATTTIDGGTGIDWLSQTGGSWTDDDFINVSNVEGLTAESPLVATLGANAAAAGINQIVGTSLNENVLLDAAFTNNLSVDLRTGGDDTINGGASSSAITFQGHFDDFTAADSLIGGTSANDSIEIGSSGSSQTADLSGMRGVETINVGEDHSGTYTIELGTGGGTPTALTINASTSAVSGQFDGETLIVNGGNYGAAITYNGQDFSTGAKDILTTGNSADNIFTGNDNDSVVSNGGNDTVDGGNGNDTVDAGAGNDSVDGSAGNDSLFGNTGNDTINGGANNDTIDGGTGIDVLDGGDGNDLIIGGGNEETPNPAVNQGDRMTGGSGDDTFRFFEISDSRGLDHDVITDWGNGNNTIDIDENVLFQAGGAATSVAFAGNAPNFAQAQGAIAATAGDGVADYVFQAGNAVEAPTLWIDVNDDGDLNAQDIQIELEGFTGTFAGGEVTLSDNATPDAPTILSIDAPAGSDDTGAENDDFITSDTTVTVRVGFSTATDGTGARVGDTVTLNGAPGGPFTSAPLVAADITNGYVDIAISGPLADSTSTLTATVNDTFLTTESSAASDPQVLVIDTTVAAPVITSADDDTAGPNGTTADGLTNDTTQTLTGTAEAGASVEVFDGATSLGTVTADATTGAWTFTTAALVDGAHSFTAVQTDLAGNVSAASAATNVTVDTQASISITTPIAGDNIVNAAEDGAVDLAGTVNDVEDAQTVTITYTDSAGTPNTVSVTTDIADGDGSGAWDTSTGTLSPANLTGLVDGVVTVDVSVTDQAGNVATDTFNITKDTAGPSLAIDSATWDSSAGTLTLNGTFDASDLNNFDPTAITVDGVALTGASTLGATSDSAIVINLNADQDNLIPASPPGAVGSYGDGTNDLVDVAAGAFQDAAGNNSNADTGNATQFDVRNTDGVIDPVVGQGLDDTFELDNAGLTATGNGGADTFHLDNIYDGTDAAGVIATITDFDASEGDLIQLDASDVNAQVTGSPYSAGDDGAAVAFSTFSSGVVTAATNIEGTLIYDDVNKTLRIDYNGDTSWDGATLTDTGNDDDIIDLTGITGTLTASDIDFLS